MSLSHVIEFIQVSFIVIILLMKYIAVGIFNFLHGLVITYSVEEESIDE